MVDIYINIASTRYISVGNPVLCHIIIIIKPDFINQGHIFLIWGIELVGV